MSNSTKTKIKIKKEFYKGHIYRHAYIYHIFFLHKYYNLIIETIITHIKINIYEEELYSFNQNLYVVNVSFQFR